jgi:hypothetical protein
MSLYSKPLLSVDESDLQAFVADQVRENMLLEYKRQLSIGSTGEKKEFLSDVSAFANSKGGYLIIGIEEAKGVPKVLSGITIANPDEERARLENLIRSGIDPRIPGLEIAIVSLANGKHAIVIHIPQSWAKPHMVSLSGSRFYIRGSGGKQPLDVREIRAAFELSGSARERVRDFRAERLTMIIAGQEPFPLDAPKTALHLIPLSIGNPDVAFDVSTIAEDMGRQTNMFMEYVPNTRGRYNADGYVTYTCLAGDPPPPCSYLQVFHNGAIEGVEDASVGSLRILEGKSEIAIRSYENDLMGALGVLLGHQRKLGVSPPILVTATLIGIADYTIEVSNRGFRIPDPFYKKTDHLIGKDPLILPELLIESFNIEPSKVLRPLFDALWRASGYASCPHYDKEGNRKPDGV